MKHVTDPLPDRLSGLPEVSPALRAIVLRALEKDREKRFPSAIDLETELALLEQAPQQHPREGYSERLAGEDEIVAALESAFNSIVLPLRTPRPEETRRPAEPAPMPVVLVVQDDVRELLKTATAICAAGCRTLEVQNGQEALEALMKGPVDLVFMDVDLPRIDGFDVTRILKSQPALASLPVLLSTSRFERSQLAFAVQSGATDLLPRPFPEESLGPRLWQILVHRGFTPPAGMTPDVGTRPTIHGPTRPHDEREKR